MNFRETLHQHLNSPLWEELKRIRKCIIWRWRHSVEVSYVHTSSEERLRERFVLSWEERWLQCWNITAAPCTYREIVSKTEPGFSQQCMVGGHASGWKLKTKKGRFRLDIRRKFFAGEQSGNGESWPDKLFILSPWKFSRPY